MANLNFSREAGRLRWAMCPTHSKRCGTSTPSGNNEERHSTVRTHQKDPHKPQTHRPSPIPPTLLLPLLLRPCFCDAGGPVLMHGA